ncbi:MAG: hypothetical protein QNM02_17785 [Acidimicrobiia bacterium]|nr:hypothetical protein [Acidimicrobiia bacterium]
MNLVERIVVLHQHLAHASIPHAFGGALALAWCTERARATIDIDLNVFIEPNAINIVTDALPDGVTCTDDDRADIERDGQTRLWWDATPVDIFCNTTRFHQDVARRIRTEEFGGAVVPFLACRDLAVFKAFFDRTKDWADLEEMAAAGTLDFEAVLGVLTLYLGGDDLRIARLRALA